MGYLPLFILMAAWEWLATLSVRWCANTDLAAIPAAGVLTAFWWVGIIQVNHSKKRAAVTILGAMAGTGLGLLF